MLWMGAISGLVVGLLAGGLAVWFAGHRRQMAATATAAELTTALARAEERAHAATSQHQVDVVELDRLRIKSQSMEVELTGARENEARLGERALRVPILEAEIERAEVQLTKGSAEVLALTQTQARTQEALDQLTASLPPLEARLAAALADRDGLAEELSMSQANLARVTAERDSLGEQLVQSRLEAERLLAAQTASGQELLNLTESFATYRTRVETEAVATTEKLAFLETAQETLKLHFRDVGNSLFEEHTKRFQVSHEQQLGPLLEGLRTRILEFQTIVAQSHTEDLEGRAKLGEQVRQLFEMSQELGKGADNLATALRGNSKVQGNWGELMLEKVLEASGLRRDHEYTVQASRRTEDGKLQQPDVVIHLPERRHLVVDAKVSLNAYADMMAATSDEARATALRSHLQSMRGHMKGLSMKAYQSLYGLESLDFVLMFVPIEPAYMTAITHDGNLFMEAYEQNVLLVCPSTILFVVRTVAHLWRQETLRSNTQKIVERGAAFYDKLVAFMQDLDCVGQRLKSAQGEYEGAYRKLTGHGGVIRQAEMLKELGVRPSKSHSSKIQSDIALHSDDDSADANDAPVDLILLDPAPTVDAERTTLDS